MKEASMTRRVVSLFAVVALTAGACSSGADTGGVASLEESQEQSESVAAELTQEEALLAFTECVREQGLDIPDPTVDADGNVRLPRPMSEASSEAERQAFREAMSACEEYLEGVTMGFEQRDTTEFRDQLFEYAQCMRDNGYDMPDPDFSATMVPGSGGGPGGGVFGSLDRDDPAFQEAQAACEEYLPGRTGLGGGFGGGGGTGG
jgi:hypothetical protein